MSTPADAENGAAVVAASARDTTETYDATTQAPIEIKTVSWFRQLYTVILHKNWHLLARKPIHMIILVLSSVWSVLLAWPAGRDHFDDDEMDVYPPYTDCGTNPSSAFGIWNATTNTTHRDPPLSLNESWRRGVPVATMALGPMLNAILVFILVHEELQLHMLGVLRNLGLLDSVYWASWYLTFGFLALVNSLLATITAITLPVHVFETTYFGGIFASLFFLQLSLIGCSLFLAAVLGTARRGAVWLILCMLIALWVPLIVMFFQSSAFEFTSRDVTNIPDPVSPTGLFWVNRQTMYTNTVYTNTNTNTNTNNTTDVCNYPIISESEANFYKTDAERALVQPDSFFLGCYASAGWGSAVWTPTERKGKIGLAIFWFFPYFHFNVIWGNFCGLTGNPNKEFNANHASMTSGELAREGLPVSPSDANAKGTTLFPQGVMLQEQETFERECTFQLDADGYCPNGAYKSNCPAQDLTGYDFCSDVEDTFDCISSPNPSPAEGKSVHSTLGMLLALSLMYTLMAAYWGIVLVGGAGTLPPYFLFLPSYWRGARKKKSSADHSEETNGTRTDVSGVQVNAVQKNFGAVEALKTASLTMARGEVTALLGHNGAGKTTLSKVLTCEIPATSGDITVFGHSVKDDPLAVRRLVGVCKQDNYLYPNMTAREHLDLYAGLRGVRSGDVDETVQKWLESVDLDTDQNMLTSQYSGGMKRRLSLALSTIGGRPLICLDEPTTGMDPVSRRFVWKHIDEIKEDRVVLLTTHAMEEADLLADMVAVMRRGELAAWGSPLALKSEHGSALQFSILVDKEKTTATVENIQEHFADVKNWIKVDGGEAGNITVNIKKIQNDAGSEGVKVGQLTSFVAWLEDVETSGVSEYGFSNSSLEEVFLKVTEGDVEVQLADDTRTVTSEDDAIAGNSMDPTAVTGRDVAGFTPRLSVRGQTGALMWQYFIRGWTGRRSIGSYVFYGLFLVISTAVSVKLANAYDKIPGLTMQVAFMSFILLSISSTIYADKAEGLFYLMRTQGLLKTSYLVGTSVYALVLTFVYGVVMLAAMYATPYWREPSICEPDIAKGEYCDYIKYGENPIINKEEIQPNPLLSVYAASEGVELDAYTVPGGFGEVFGAAVVFSLTVPGAALASSYLPGYKFALVIIALFALVASITPLIIYFIGVLIWDENRPDICLNEMVSNGNFKGTCAEAVIQSFVDSEQDFGEDFLNCVGIFSSYDRIRSLCIPAHAGLLPQFGLFQMLSVATYSRIKFISEPPEFVEESFIPKIKGVKCWGDTCAFPFAFSLYGRNAGWMIFGAFILIVVGVAIAHVFAFPTALVLRIKNYATHLIKRLRCRFRKPKQFEKPVEEKKELGEVAAEREAVSTIVKPLLTEPSIEALEEGDDAEEPAIADHHAIERDDLPPILMHKLRKVYPSIGRLPPKVALKSLDLHVPKGQVLGFLGKNGAGKTTALKILAGAHDATSGVALVSGYDVSCERIRVYESLGNCPQFDVIWPKLTVKEHLVFFAKLKGLPRKDIQSAAHNIATAVGLGADQVYNRRAGALSGGMRRRLSIAISLVGAPKSFVLDEPTTGLDPSTRNNIWGLINSFATEDRAIIITTHMMLEADTLCNRIAIISQGELVVVASQQTLKDKYGSGYLLQLNLVKSTLENQVTAMEFAQKHLHKQASLGTKQAKTLHVNLPRDLDLEKAFSALYDADVRPACINQFLLSQSSLEDVFLALGE